jgi:hypothetical protein
MLSKPCVESSLGRYFAGSIDRSSTSRSMLAYSVRFSRCRPGGGMWGGASRSSSCSRNVIIDSNTAGSGRRMPAGGIMPARILRTIISHLAASFLTLVTSRASNVSFCAPSPGLGAFFALSLWHATQYWSSMARCSAAVVTICGVVDAGRAVGCAAGAAACAGGADAADGKGACAAAATTSANAAPKAASRDRFVIWLRAPS